MVRSVAAGETLRLNVTVDTTGVEADNGCGKQRTEVPDEAVGSNPLGSPMAENIAGNTCVSLRKQLHLATWDVRSLIKSGKLNVVCNEMERMNISILGLAEVRWTGRGCFETAEDYMVL